MKTTNGLDVPQGWGRRRPEPKQPCPLCGKATRLVPGPAGRTYEPHTRYGKSSACRGGGRLVTTNRV